MRLVGSPLNKQPQQMEVNVTPLEQEREALEAQLANRRTSGSGRYATARDYVEGEDKSATSRRGPQSPVYTWDFAPQEAHRRFRRTSFTARPLSPTTPKLCPEPSPPMARAVSLQKLKVRQGPALDSPLIGNVLMGRMVILIEEKVLGDGTTRARVGKDSSPRGAVMEPIGWITSVKDGKHGLKKTTAVEHRADSMASRIAQRRMERMEAPPPEEPFRWLDSIALSVKSSTFWPQAMAAEAAIFDTIEERLAFLLIEQDVSEEELLRKSDVDADGEVAPAEFRKMVRGLLSPERTAAITTMGTDAEMDKLFSKIDIDSSGGLELQELQLAFSKLKGNLRIDKYSGAAAKYRAAAAKAIALRECGVAFEEASRDTASHEQAVLALEAMQSGTIKSRLGDTLKAKKIKVSDLKNKWDSDGNGKLDRNEFNKNIMSLGFEASDEEYNELFDSLDVDHSGSLASKELVESLKQILLESVNKIVIEQDHVQKIAQALSTAEKSQGKAHRLAKAAAELSGWKLLATSSLS